MIDLAWFSIGVCIAALVVTVFAVREDKASIGLPIAYMVSLLLIHVPGGFAYATSGGRYTGVLAGGDYPAIGMALTAAGCVAFVVGLLVARRIQLRSRSWPPLLLKPTNRRFWVFCVVGGWLFYFGLSPLSSVPTLGAVINFGSAIWMLGAMLGLAHAISTRQVASVIRWIAASLVYPMAILLFAGFLSYGSTALIIVGSFVLSRLKRVRTVLVAMPFAAFLGLSVFVNYFEHRDMVRDVVWSGAGIDERIEVVWEAFSNFELFDINNPRHLQALAARLNQNEFAGLAYERLENGQVEFLEGRSFVEGLIALVPRAIWPDKPVYGGSPAVVAEMTGLQLNRSSFMGGW